MNLAASHGNELADLRQLRSHCRGKEKRILAHLIAAGQQNVLIAKTVRRADNLGTMFKAAAQRTIGYTQEFVILGAEGGEGHNLNRAGRPRADLSLRSISHLTAGSIHDF
jgi:hypothetical protein